MKVCNSCGQFRILDDDDSVICERCQSAQSESQKTPNVSATADNYAVRKLYNQNQLAVRLQELRAQKWSLRKIAEVEFGGRISHATIARCLTGNFPKRTKNRLAMGLPITAPAPVCPVHNKVHTKPCRATRSPKTLSDYRDLFAAPVGILLSALENREEFAHTIRNEHEYI